MDSIQKIWLVTILCFIAPPVFSQKFPVIHPDEIIAKYGKPDRTISTEYDKPRPPFVTRLLVYTKEHVRYAFFPGAPVGSSPPYHTWHLLGTQDFRDNAVISADEATQRMRSREKK